MGKCYSGLSRERRRRQRDEDLPIEKQQHRGSAASDAVCEDFNNQPKTHPPASVPVPSPTEDSPPETAGGSGITRASVCDDVINQPETQPHVSVPAPSPTEDGPPETAGGSGITRASVCDDVINQPETQPHVSVPAPSPTEEGPPETAGGSGITHASVCDDVISQPQTHHRVSVPVPSPTDVCLLDTAEESDIKDAVCRDDDSVSGVVELMSHHLSKSKPDINASYLDKDRNKCLMIRRLPCSLVDRTDVHTLKLEFIDRMPPGVAHMTNLRKLEIHHCNFTDESSLLQVDHLTHLDIMRSNNIRLPAAAPHLTSLRINGRDVTLPDSVSQWTSLTSLSLQHYDHHLPVDFTNILPQLTHLFICDCGVMRLPDKVISMTSLQSLKLLGYNHPLPDDFDLLMNELKTKLKHLSIYCNNHVECIPPGVLNLSCLTTLWLAYSNINDIPPGVFNMISLTKLNLSGNNIISVPCGISKLIKLEEIDLRNNDIKELPEEIADMDQLHTIELEGNFGMMRPPPEIYAKGANSIKNYLKDLVKHGSSEKSLLTVQVVGETEAGKTSLCDTLIGGKSKLARLDDRTKVVRICKWEPEQNVFIRFHDFGGHGAYKVTTPFFLSPRTLNLILYDVTKNDVDGFFTCFIGKWYDSILDVIPTARVALVGTHCDENMKMQIPDLEDVIRKALENKKQERKKVNDRRLKYLTRYVKDCEGNMQFTRPKHSSKMKNNDDILLEQYKTEIPVLKNALNHLKTAVPLFWISSKTMDGFKELEEFLIAECHEKRLVQPKPWSSFAEAITSERKHKLYLPMKVVHGIYAELHPRVHVPQQIIDVQLAFFHDTGKVLRFNLKSCNNSSTEDDEFSLESDVDSSTEGDWLSLESGNDSGSQIVVHNIDLFVMVLREFFQHDIVNVLQDKADDDRFDDIPEQKLESMRDTLLSSGVMKLDLFRCLISPFGFNEEEVRLLVDLFKSFHLCFDVNYKGDESGHLRFPWFLPAERPKELDNKWPALSDDKFELGFKMQFSLSIPQNFFQHSQVILHQNVGTLYGDYLDYSSGTYAYKKNAKILLEQSNKTTVQLRVRSPSLVEASKLMTELKTELENKGRDGWPGATFYTCIICAHCLCVGIIDHQQVFEITTSIDSTTSCFCKKGGVGVPPGLVYPVKDGDTDVIDVATRFIEQLKFSQSNTTGSRDFSVRKIKYNPSVNQVLGYGFHTVVYRGSWDGKPAAIKKVQLTTPGTDDERELEILRKVNHENVIRYYDWEKDKGVLYIAFELCEGTLQQLVDDPTKFQNLQTKQLLKDMMEGLKHLHSEKIVHRDIKPSNVLISTPDVSGVSRVRVSDLGLSKAMTPGQDKLSGISGSVGTQGWIAPEMVKGAKDVTSAVDIFSAGCVIYYILTGGHHPFDPPPSRQHLISQGHYNLSRLSPRDCDELCAAELVESMIQHKPSQRPTADVVLKHTLFWSYGKKAKFFQDVSDRILNEPVTSQTMIDLENHKVFNGDWLNYLCYALQTDLTSKTAKKRSSRQPNIEYSKYAQYDKTKVKSLLRVIRNMKHHIHGRPVAIKNALNTDWKFMDYFLCAQRFPLLLVHVHRVMKAMKSDATLTEYY